MATDAEQLTVTSTSDDRSAAVSNCISQIQDESPGISNEKARAICIDRANKAMGTKSQDR